MKKKPAKQISRVEKERIAHEKAKKTLTTAVGKALIRAGEAARKTARAYGTPIYYWKNGKMVAEKP
ncbi:MAG: hypothetical protein ABIQ35_12275 [Verrucomicrobiota bacterium]